jgi:crossover junction endodeoxyribonuclease RuvC
VIPADLVPAGCTWPIVLGIDPGTRMLGYGALVLAPGGPRFLACGVIQPAARAAVPARLAEIQAGIERLIAALRPGVLAIERAFHSKNAQSAFRIGEARGVVLAAAARAGIEILELAPASAKKAVLGHGAASKEQVARMIAQLLGTGPLDVPSDATDALALAFACLKRRSAPAALAPQARRRAAHRARPA